MKPDWFGHLTTDHSNFAAHFRPNLRNTTKRGSVVSVEGKTVSVVSKQQHDGLCYLNISVLDHYRSSDWRGEATYSAVWTVAKEKSPSA